MPKTLFGKKVPEEYWTKAKKLAKEQGINKKDKDRYYKYTMGILKQMMSETVVSGDVAVPSGVIKKSPKKWNNIIKQIEKE